MGNIQRWVRSAPGLDEDAWEDLLSFIEERRVIPIVGPELLKLDTANGPMLFQDWVATKLVVKLGVSTSDLPSPFTLNDVVSWFLAMRGRREDTYARVRAILRETEFEPPKALRQLAEITDFNLFVTTTFDSFLEQAINLQRFGGTSNTDVIGYTPNRVADIPAELADLRRPLIYHLLGRCSASPTYVLSDEDLLEYVCALQREHLTPEKLFHELEHNHLLIIGNQFGNWLARLFLRLAKRRRLSDPRDVGEILADDHSSEDDRLATFLQQVSVRTRLYTGAEAFVDELHRRWMARHRAGTAPLLGGGERFVPPEREMRDRAVFISYAREDLPAVQRLKAQLDDAGIDCWLDMDRLESGVDFDLRIQRNITRCAYFIPVISTTTERRTEAFFRREWSYAIDRSRNMADDSVFILPVMIDAVDARVARIPEKFRSLHVTTAPAGHAPAEFVRYLQTLLTQSPP
ncbi:MAG: hypothetical protein RL580_1096 [Pseudomonadota bacterium]